MHISFNYLPSCQYLLEKPITIQESPPSSFFFKPNKSINVLLWWKLRVTLDIISWKKIWIYIENNGGIPSVSYLIFKGYECETLKIMRVMNICTLYLIKKIYYSGDEKLSTWI